MEQQKIARVLIIDDDYICLKALKDLLIENYSCKVDAFRSVEEILTRIYEIDIEQEWQPVGYDIIFVDIQLPKFNGDVLASIIRKTKTRLKTTPIIAITAYSKSLTDENKLKKMGITDLIIKPVIYKTLDTMLNKYLPSIPRLSH